MSAEQRSSSFTFSLIAAIGLVLGFVGAALAIGATQADPGQTGRQGRQTIQGVYFQTPYPHIRTAPRERFPEGRTIPLTSPGGKRGVNPGNARFDGQFVEAFGAVIRRGDGEMLQVQRGIKAIDGAPQLTEVEDLGRWRLSGEICDGQCVLGVMKPGRGLAHKACANLCIVGGVPPLFVTAQPVEGSQFMLLADAEGRPLPEKIYDLTAILIAAEGRLERRGNLLVFHIDLDSIEVL